MGKHGPKLREEWLTVVAAWFIKIAIDDPDRLQQQSLNRLVYDAQDFLQQQIGWCPEDHNRMRDKIVELLQFVRR